MGDPATKIWSVEEAATRFADLMKRAQTEGPQHIASDPPCVVTVETTAERLEPGPPGNAKPGLARWIYENMPPLDEVELPDRKAERDRTPDFDSDP
jgi:hypothetical protein